MPDPRPVRDALSRGETAWSARCAPTGSGPAPCRNISGWSRRIAVQAEHLGHLVENFFSEIGRLNEIVHIWAYAVWTTASGAGRRWPDPRWVVHPQDPGADRGNGVPRSSSRRRSRPSPERARRRSTTPTTVTREHRMTTRIVLGAAAMALSRRCLRPGGGDGLHQLGRHHPGRRRSRPGPSRSRKRPASPCCRMARPITASSRHGGDGNVSWDVVDVEHDFAIKAAPMASSSRSISRRSTRARSIRAS